MDELRRRIMQLEIEREAIRREKDTEKEAVLNKELAELNEKFNGFKAQWENEKGKVDEIRQLKESIDHLKFEAEQAERSGDFGKVAEIRYGKLPEAESRLNQLAENARESGENLINEEVTSEDIAEVVAKWTGIPVSKMLQSEREKLLYLEN